MTSNDQSHDSSNVATPHSHMDFHCEWELVLFRVMYLAHFSNQFPKSDSASIDKLKPKNIEGSERKVWRTFIHWIIIFGLRECSSPNDEGKKDEWHVDDSGEAHSSGGSNDFL